MSRKQEKPGSEEAGKPSIVPPDRDEVSDHDLDKASGGFSFDIEQTLNIGSQATGAGAGKVTFNPFTAPKK